MTLLYDSSCALCRSLAFKVHLISDGAVALVSLRTPEGKAILDKFYPSGWKWDFYVVTGDRCKRGVWSVPALARALGFRNVLSLVRDYANYRRKKQSSSRCAAAPVDPESRRAAIKAAILLPLFTGLSRLAIVTAPPPRWHGASKLVHIARVSALDSVDIEQCDTCVQEQVSPGISQRSISPSTSTVKRSFEQISRESLLDESISLVPTDTPLRIGLESIAYRLVRNDGTGPVPEAEYALFPGSIVDASFNVSLTAANDGALSMGGMCRHDVPGWTIDYLVWTGPAVSGGTIAAAYGTALRRLAAVHSDAGRLDLGASYLRMAAALTELGVRFDKHLPQGFAPSRNVLIVTSMPDLMSSVSLPADLPIPRHPRGTKAAVVTSSPDEPAMAGGPSVAPEAPYGDDKSWCSFGCSCDCFFSLCLSCGCGFQACIPPLPICSCGTCIDIFGCGCGVCCGGWCACC